MKCFNKRCDDFDSKRINNCRFDEDRPDWCLAYLSKEKYEAWMKDKQKMKGQKKATNDA